MDQLSQCKGLCLFGQCPYPKCRRAASSGTTAQTVTATMDIMTDIVLPPNFSATKQGIGVAVDIGTTTVALYLYDLSSATCLATTGRLNAQVSFGVDVISRIQYCAEHEDGLFRLHDAIITQLNQLTDILLQEAGVSRAQVKSVVVTGNTVMMHLFANLSPVSMGQLPFHPLSTFHVTKAASDYGLALPNAECYLPPCLSAFLGGDTLCALLATEFSQQSSLSLLMDIGTNGELALGNKTFISCTATAAGPAFEGAHMSCGMASVQGAISGVNLLSGQLQLEVIGNKKPIGICGSGLLDAIALMLETGIMDETGRLDESCEAVTNKDGQLAFFLTKDISITQHDIRELQTAKAAIAAGVLALLKNANHTTKEVDTLYLAGGFGNRMSEQSAKTIGLIPKDISHVSIAGNAAATGAVLCLLDPQQREQLEHIKHNAATIDLAADPYFMEQYIASMYFE